MSSACGEEFVAVFVEKFASHEHIGFLECVSDGEKNALFGNFVTDGD